MFNFITEELGTKMNLCINFFGYSVSVSSQICYDADFGIVQPGKAQ